MSTPAPVFAPTVGTYATRTPYLTAAEYKAAATGVDVSSLVPRGTADDQAAALKTTIARASSWADTYCRQVLAATRDRQAGRYRVRRDGTIAVPLDYSPVVAIAAVSVGTVPGQLTAFADLSSVDVGEKVATFPAWPSAASTGGPLPYFDGRRLADGRVFAVVDYVNGFANTALTADAAAGAQSLTVASPLAVFPGMTLTIADAGSTEQVTVAAGFAPTVTLTPTAVPLAAPTTKLHTAGTALGALPEAIKEAVILLTSALIKTRGTQAIAMPSMGGQPARTQPGEAGSSLDEALAYELLENFRRAA